MEQQLVVFSLGREEFGVDISRVREIVRLQNITSIPRSTDSVEGFVNLRGPEFPGRSSKDYRHDGRGCRQVGEDRFPHRHHGRRDGDHRRACPQSCRIDVGDGLGDGERRRGCAGGRRNIRGTERNDRAFPGGRRRRASLQILGVTMIFIDLHLESDGVFANQESSKNRRVLFSCA